MDNSKLKTQDKEIYDVLKKEENRQQYKLSMIPSENFFSKAVREAVGSVFMHKYSEGNIGKRYYEGNQYIDQLETLAKQRAAKLFNIPKDWDANVQALSGSSANLAVYLAVLNPGDTMFGMYLPDGGHLSHGWSYEPNSVEEESNRVYKGGSSKVNITSRMFNTLQYKTNPQTHLFDYDEIEKIALEYKPKLIITGGTAYPRDIDYKKMKSIAQKVGALYMADIAHEAGLVAAGVINSPIGIADIVTMTTQKTLRAGRGAIILAHKDLIKKINRAVLPGLQGGPFNNNIAGIAVGLGEALQPEFKDYAKQIISNAKTLEVELKKYGFDLVSGGTDKHLILIDMTNKKVSGKYSARALDFAGIVLNMNTMPGEKRSPSDPSAIRLGTPLLTTRGMKEQEMIQIAKWLNEVIEEIQPYANIESFDEFQEKVKESKTIKRISEEIKEICIKYPLDI